MKWLKTIFCRHKELTFVRNIYGDEIVHSGSFKRSWWKCNRCGMFRPKSSLHEDLE